MSCIKVYDFVKGLEYGTRIKEHYGIVMIVNQMETDSCYILTVDRNLKFEKLWIEKVKKVSPQNHFYFKKIYSVLENLFLYRDVVLPSDEEWDDEEQNNVETKIFNEPALWHIPCRHIDSYVTGEKSIEDTLRFVSDQKTTTFYK